MNKHIRLFEFGDLDWCPQFIKRGITEILAVISRTTGLFRCTGQLIKQHLGPNKEILVLAAGSGGGILDVMGDLPKNVKVRLTDLNPDLEFTSNDARLRYVKKPINALTDLRQFPGLRVMYDSFHHLSPDQATTLLKSIERSREPFVTFEASDRSISGLLACLASPFYVLAFLPKIRHLRFLQIVCTYIIPIIPLVMLWDGLVSCLRVYSSEELKQMTAGLDSYEWKIGKVRGRLGEPIRYLAGWPRD